VVGLNVHVNRVGVPIKKVMKIGTMIGNIDKKLLNNAR